MIQLPEWNHGCDVQYCGDRQAFWIEWDEAADNGYMGRFAGLYCNKHGSHFFDADRQQQIESVCAAAAQLLEADRGSVVPTASPLCTWRRPIMDELTRRAEDRLRRDIENDRHGTVTLVSRGELLRQEAKEAEHVAEAEERGYANGRESVLHQVERLRAEILTSAGRSEIVGQWMDGVNKARFLGDVIEVLRRS